MRIYKCRPAEDTGNQHGCVVMWLVMYKGVLPDQG